jgi:hypothetical protein
MCKKQTLNETVNNNTFPSPNKAIQQNKIKLNNRIGLNMMQEKISRKSCNKKCPSDVNVSNDNNNVSSDNITMKALKRIKP